MSVVHFGYQLFHFSLQPSALYHSATLLPLIETFLLIMNCKKPSTKGIGIAQRQRLRFSPSQPKFEYQLWSIFSSEFAE